MGSRNTIKQQQGVWSFIHLPGAVQLTQHFVQNSLCQAWVLLFNDNVYVFQMNHLSGNIPFWSPAKIHLFLKRW